MKNLPNNLETIAERMKWAVEQSEYSAPQIAEKAGIYNAKGEPNPAYYNLAIKVKDNKAQFKYTLGESTSVYGGYPAKSELPKIENRFKSMSDDIVAAINKQDSF